MKKRKRNAKGILRMDKKREAWKKEIKRSSSSETGIKVNPNITIIENEIKALKASIDSASSKIKTLQITIHSIQNGDIYQNNQFRNNQAIQTIAALEKNKELYRHKIIDGEQILKKLELASTENIIKENANGRDNKTITIEWDNLTFLNDFIAVRVNDKWFERFPIKNAQKSLNAIKSHYKFRNAPKLTLEINQNRILRIVNVEVLFYYIQFLENAGSQFKIQFISSIPIFGKYKIYTKAYYKKHMPELFQSRCFNLLSELVDNEFCIIPVPETVISSNKIHQIHDSFLFPVVIQTKIFWLWESIEESKATYLFETNRVDFESKVQIVFDYLTGDTVNKRETLINSPKLRQDLSLVKRIMHDDFNNWEDEIHHALGKA